MHLHLDCSSGIAGDMVLGALVGAGGDFPGLVRALETLPLKGWTLECEEVERVWLVGTRVRVLLEGEEKVHRHLPEIEKMIAGSGLTPRAKSLAIAAFRCLAAAEGKVHGIPPEEVHFHEVGAVDAIIDICGAMHLFDALGVQSASASAINVGSGTVKCAHGTMPVPAPATAELLKGVPTYADGPAVELATPTGAAIVTTLATEFGRMPTMRVQAVGNGAGEKEFEGRANFVRAMLGVREEATGLPVESRTLVILSTEIDDMSPELLAPVIGKLLESGAVDAHLEPIQMKKGRAGQRLVALAPPDRRDAVAERIFRETSTFGLKVQEATGLCLARRMDSVETPHGPVKVKVGLWGDDVLRVTPEFEDCHRLAEEKGVPLAAVHTAALAAICARWGTGSPITP